MDYARSILHAADGGRIVRSKDSRRDIGHISSHDVSIRAIGESVTVVDIKVAGSSCVCGRVIVVLAPVVAPLAAGQGVAGLELGAGRVLAVAVQGNAIDHVANFGAGRGNIGIGDAGHDLIRKIIVMMLQLGEYK